MIVYGIFFPNGKVYIGITKRTLAKRMYQHTYAAFYQAAQTKLARAMRKYVPQLNVYHVIIYNGDTYEELAEVEKMFIMAYDSYKNGYNETLGGLGWSGHKHSKKTKEKYSVNRKIDANERLTNARKKLKELYQDPEYRKRFKDSISNRRKENLSDEDRNKLGKRRGMFTFLVHKENGEFIGEFSNRVLCMERLKIGWRALRTGLNNPGKESKGFIFTIKSEA